MLEKNIFTKNNIERITGYYPAAVKIFNQSHRVTCRDNLIIDLPYSNGVWYDVGEVDGVFINNWIEGVGLMDREFTYDELWPSDNGFFFEISHGLICAGNVFVNCDHGMLILNSSNAKIYQNTFVNSTACIGRNARSFANDHFGWHSNTAPDVQKRNGHVFVNNLLTGNGNFHKPLLIVWEPDSVCSLLPDPQLKQMDNNIYVRNQDKNNFPLILWSPAKNDKCQQVFQTPESLHKQYPGFSASGQYYPYGLKSLFKSSELDNYQVLSTFPGLKKAVVLPDNVRELLGLPRKYTPYIGAFSAMP